MNLQIPPGVPLTIRLVEHTVLAETVEDSRFLRHARSCGAKSHGVVLLSGGQDQMQSEGRYSIAGWDPLLTFESKGHSCRIRSPRGMRAIEGDPLRTLDGLFAGIRADYPLIVPPFSGGAMGYFAYDLKNTIERLPQTAEDDLGLPDIFLVWPSRILVHDRLKKHLHFLALSCDEQGTAARSEPRHESGPFSKNMSLFEQGEPAERTERADTRRAIRVGALESNFKHEDYLQAVSKVRHYIREGDIYQVNISQRYRFPLEGDPFQLWESLYEMNPAPFYAYINAGDHQVLSTSMERFLSRRGSTIETRPIKGTRKRGATPEEDEALRIELQGDPKEDAELSMIVDLLRNDLGRVCSPRSIRVAEHKRLETYQNVHHLVSIVTGELRPRTTYGDLLRGTFPGGSITGCPKIRSMEIIDEMEPHVRHVYTGSIGYLGFHENLDLNVAIRTGLVHKSTCYFSVGGGIVYDSKEEDEYQETLHKGRTLFQLIEKIGASEP